MIILRNNYFSNTVMDKLEEKLRSEGIEDFEVSNKIPKDVISIFGTNLNDIKIYIPIDLEYSQYEIDDFIREQSKFIRTRVELDRDIYIMRLSGSLTQLQLFNLVKFIIEDQGFCTILNI